MGSLLPGWNERSPGVAPKEFQDYDEEDEEQMGYFAAYNKMKKERGDLGRKSAPMLMRRQSMPTGRVSDFSGSPVFGSRTLEKSATFAPRSLDTSGSFMASSPPLQRLRSMPLSAGDRLEGPRTPKSPLSPSAGSGDHFSANLEGYKTHQEPKHEVQWWRNFDSAHLNEEPDIPMTKERSYIPQYKVAGQDVHYRVDGGKTAGVLLEGVDVS